MNVPDLPETLLHFLQSTVPTFPAAELLLYLEEHPGPWHAEQIVPAIRPVVITRGEAEEFLGLFKQRGLVREEPEGFRYAPDPAGEKCVGELRKAYNERPVTLIRTISLFAEHKLQSFADAFKIQRD